MNRSKMTMTNKEELYASLFTQIQALTEKETDMIANMANIAALLKENFSFLWVGFYLVKKEELVLGPYQGPLACTRIRKGKGVCGKSWDEQKALIIPNVNEFEGHIACNSASRSEIVIPIADIYGIYAVLDIDSSEYDDFDDIDLENLLKITSLLNFTNNDSLYFKEAPISVTICDKDAYILEMNNRSVETFSKDGASLIGNSLYNCHPEVAQNMIKSMLTTHLVNAYTIEKKGVKKLIYQMPWFKNDIFAGYIELSMVIPNEMKHFIRKP